MIAIEPFVLMPCPFCGNAATLRTQRDLIIFRAWIVRCDSCSSEVNWAMTAQEAVEMWNNRTGEKEDGK